MNEHEPSYFPKRECPDDYAHTWLDQPSPPPVVALLPNPFTEDYYLRGPDTGLSNYVDYHFMEPETRQYAVNLTRHLGLRGGETVHDIGCSRGYLAKVLNDMGNPTTGHDISEWAIRNCHPDVMDDVSTSCDFAPSSVDWVHGKDTLEHWDEKELKATLPKILSMARKGSLFIVPLVAYWGGKYIYPADNLDKTHKIRMPLDSWLRMFMEAAKQTEGNFSIHGSYHMFGLKKASVDHPYSTCFITTRRFPV